MAEEENVNKQSEMFETDEVSVIQDGDELDAHGVVSYVTSRFKRAEDARYTDESRWLRAYRNYRGLYGSDVRFTETEKSRIFVKVTKTKTLAAYGQIVDVLFGSSRFPLTVNPTTLPEGVAESMHINVNPQAEQAMDPLRGAFEEEPKVKFLFDPDEKLKPGETMYDRMKRMGSLQKKLEVVGDKVIEGPGTTQDTVTFHPAMVAAKQMEKKIHDQLEESGANKQLRHTSFEMALFGTGIMKGPFAIDKEYPSWGEDGEYNPTVKTVPSTSHVSIWNFYPDPDAYNMDDVEYVVERHRMTRSQMRGLKSRPFFRTESIDEAIALGESYEKKYWEQDMEDEATYSSAPERFEVLEFWGYVDTEMLKEQGVKIPKELKNSEQVNVNAWICNSKVLRLVLNPFKPTRIPYYAVPYELNPYSFFGVGIAENMDDTQTLMNGFMRMAIDNAALSGNLIIEVDETNLVPGQDLSVYPGKVFRRQGGAPGQGIFGTKFPNVANENMQLFDKARVLADESTGFPSFAHGQTGVSGVGRTASGISMLMSAANGSIRNVVKNVDDYLIGPIGRAFFAFNMQFDFDKEIKGDLEVKASGTESLMANEVRSQRLMQFMGVASNPALMPFVKSDYIIREIAKSMDLDPDKVTNSLGDAAIQAEILKKFTTPPEPPAGAEQGPPAPPTPGAAPEQAGVGVADTTGAGGGNIGTGTAPTPGEQGFTGT
tara:strand:- start:4226 stop:6364 length:2139 start_codon:yes stop_codon:yes gene_type:complete